MYIENLHPSSHVTYKIKTTDPKIFTVKPIIGIIPPGKYPQAIDIKFLFSKKTDLDAMKNKFMIQSSLINIDKNERKDPKIQIGFWQNAKGKPKEEIQSNVLKIIIIENIERKNSGQVESVNEGSSDNKSSLNFSETSRLTFSDPVMVKYHMDTVTEVMNDSESKD